MFSSYQGLKMEHLYLIGESVICYDGFILIFLKTPTYVALVFRSANSDWESHPFRSKEIESEEFSLHSLIE